MTGAIDIRSALLEKDKEIEELKRIIGVLKKEMSSFKNRESLIIKEVTPLLEMGRVHSNSFTLLMGGFADLAETVADCAVKISQEVEEVEKGKDFNSANMKQALNALSLGLTDANHKMRKATTDVFEMASKLSSDTLDSTVKVA